MYSFYVICYLLVFWGLDSSYLYKVLSIVFHKIPAYLVTSYILSHLLVMILAFSEFCVGLMLLGIYSNFGETFDCIYLIVCQDLYFSIHLLYWHFVEVIWLLLYYFLYLYWMLLYNLFCVNTKGSYYA